MKPAICQFCGREFDSSQGVRAHLRFCPDYRQVRQGPPRHGLPRHDRIEAGVAFASRELRKEADLDGWTRGEIEQKVKQILEQDIADDESEAGVEARVDEILDREVDAVDEQRRAKARPKLIAHGASYAARELAPEKDLDASDRWEIQQAVKQELEQRITGDESEDDVEALVNEFLDGELGEPGEDDEGY